MAETLICEYCKKEFTVPYGMAGNRKYCSRACGCQARKDKKLMRKQKSEPKIFKPIIREDKPKLTNFVNTGDDFSKQFIGRVVKI